MTSISKTPEVAALSELQPAIEAALDDNLPHNSKLAPRLLEAMRYAVLAGLLTAAL